ncbi:hypothetical protein C8Q76DRAFT_232004 [Earliella scabrosa]|nr:hypothetical protein C8Q76DRAFT_232004 [Earliella scabrosa]
MNHSRLPVDICEHLIDACWDHSVHPRVHRYATWRQTSLVCSAWLPRSRYNLLYAVCLSQEDDVRLLLRTLQETPHFADLICVLQVQADWTRSVPITLLQLFLLLKNCRAATFDFIPWGVYPPQYARIGFFPLSAVTDLRIDVDRSVLHNALRFVWSLHHLQFLQIRWKEGRQHTKDLLQRRSLARVRPPGNTNFETSKCKSLQSLRLRNAECALVPWSGCSPFGSSVEKLTISVRKGVSDNTLQCIEGFRRLEHLKIYCKLDPPPSSDPTSTTPASLRTQMRTLRNLRSVLSSVRSGSALQSITINVGFTKTLRHVVDHTTLLDDLLASYMVAILSGFSGLRRLHLIVYDGDEEYGSQQWTAEMVRRLPDSWPAQAAVSVEVAFPAVRDE